MALTKSILDEALRLAELGYAVFPCAPGEKRPATANGVLDATSDLDQIERWWTEQPNANIGLATGGLLVVDLDCVDGKSNHWLAEQPERLNELTRGALAITPRGGRHFYFREVDRRQFRNSASKIAPHVDTRARGGYVLVPPSTVSGKPYAWVEGLSLDGPSQSLPEPPDWLVDLLDGKGSRGDASPRSEQPTAANAIPAGQRNSTLASLGGSMRRVGMSAAEILAALQKVNGDRCRPPLDAGEVDIIAESVARYQPDSLAVAIVEGQEAEAADTGPDDPGAVPADLLHVPGFIDDVMQYMLATAPYPQPVLAFGAALALQAFLASRKVRDSANNRTNLYVLGLANSGGGKDHPRKVTQQVLLEAGLADCHGDTLASAEGLEDTLFVRPGFIFLIDEMDGLLAAVKQGKDVRQQGIMHALLKLFTSSNAIHPMRVKAGKDHALIDQPGLTLYGTAIPRQLYESMSMAMLTNGFFARLLILEADKRGLGQDPPMVDLPESIKKAATYWADFMPGEKHQNLAAWHPIPRIVETTAEAATMLSAFRAEADRDYQLAESQDDQAGMTIWARANEKAHRLALNYACSESYEFPSITENAAAWACDLVRHQTRRMLWMAAAHVSENEFDARCQRFCEVLRKWNLKRGPQAWMPKWQMSRKLRGWTPRDFDEVAAALSGRGTVEHESVAHDGAGRPGDCFRRR